MKKTKQTLAFEQLEAEMELISFKELETLKGGVDSGEYEWGIDPQGNMYYRIKGTDTWTSYTQSFEVTVTPGGGYGSSGFYNPYPIYGGGGAGGGGSGTGAGGGNDGSGVVPPYAIPLSQMDTSSELAKFMGDAEGGFHATIYTNDGNNSSNPTIGYGHKLTPTEIANNTYTGKTISEADALALFQQDVKMAKYAVQQNITVSLTQYQFDALVCFAYQQGYGNFVKSDVRALINAGNFNGAMDALRNITQDHKDGRFHRHEEESDLFQSGDYNFAPYNP